MKHAPEWGISGMRVFCLAEAPKIQTEHSDTYGAVLKHYAMLSVGLGAYLLLSICMFWKISCR